MGSAERGLGRALALAASEDWCVSDLPAALQGGTRRAIFRGLYKGAEAAARRLVSARAGEGRSYSRPGSPNAEAAGVGPRAGFRLSLWYLAEPRAPGACGPRGQGSRAALLALARPARR